MTYRYGLCCSNGVKLCDWIYDFISKLRYINGPGNLDNRKMIQKHTFIDYKFFFFEKFSSPQMQQPWLQIHVLGECVWKTIMQF